MLPIPILLEPVLASKPASGNEGVEALHEALCPADSTASTPCKTTVKATAREAEAAATGEAETRPKHKGGCTEIGTRTEKQAGSKHTNTTQKTKATEVATALPSGLSLCAMR
jgi:hypothetical protein